MYNGAELLYLADAYKYTHYKQYPPGTTNIYSYYESRGGEFDNIVFFGLQYYINKYLNNFWIDHEDVEEAEKEINSIFGKEYFYREGWNYIIDEYGGCELPITIRAVPEGTVCNPHDVLMVIENTDARCFWLTNYLETLLCNLWYPCTVASQGLYIRMMMKKYWDAAGQKMNGCELNDFGMRGCTSPEQQGIGGMAHLVNWKGTDNVYGIQFARKYYGAENPVGLSVAAAEHSTITSWGKPNEAEAYKYIIKQYDSDAIISIVCDSYDTEDAIERIFGWILFEDIVHREGKIVLRPDSGDPASMAMMTMMKLHHLFGAEKNHRGYYEINPKVGMIYGDGIDKDSIKTILENVVNHAHYAPGSLVFGSGGALLQKVNRDTCKFAFKCSAAKVFDKWINVQKQPITDKSKWSKAGRVGEHLPIVYNGGEILSAYTFEGIRHKLDKFVEENT